MERSVSQVSAFHASRDLGAWSSGLRKSLNMGQVDRVRARIQVAGQQPERAQLRDREAVREQRLLRYGGVFERLVKPGDDACVPRNTCSDPAYVVDQPRPTAIALPVVEPFGQCTCTISAHHRRACRARRVRVGRVRHLITSPDWTRIGRRGRAGAGLGRLAGDRRGEPKGFGDRAASAGHPRAPHDRSDGDQHTLNLLDRQPHL